MTAKWVLLPVLGAPAAHAPVLKWDLLPTLRRPVDGGRRFRGRRLFGDNKTWRGALFMTAGPTLAAVALQRAPWWRDRLPPDLDNLPPAVLGALLGFSVFAGELPNSFAKRQLDVPPGGRRRGVTGVALSIADQADFVVMALALLRPFWRWSPRDAAELLAVATAVHLPMNVVGYAVGARSSPL